jgi:hypothetical protein
MKMCCIVLFCFIAFLFLPVLSYSTVKCEGDGDDSIVLTLVTADDGSMIDLALMVGDEIMRFPEANRTSVALPAERYNISVKKTASHDALNLNISGESGRMRFRGQNIILECIWY